MEWRSGGEAGSRLLECAGTSCVPSSRQTVNFLSSMGKGGDVGGAGRELGKPLLGNPEVGKLCARSQWLRKALKSSYTCMQTRPR